VGLKSGTVLPADVSNTKEYLSGMMVLGFTFTAPVLKSKVKTVNTVFFLEIYIQLEHPNVVSWVM
jgi:hypothetical protein